MKTNPASADLLAIFERVFPISSGHISLELPSHDGASPVSADADALRATVMLIVWDGDGATRSVRDIKQQDCLVCDQRVHELPERLDAGLQAHAIVLRALFADTSRGVDTMMPIDLFFPDIFRLKTARTVEDFTRALAAKSRLDAPALRDRA